MRPWIDPRLQTALAKACMPSCTSRTPALDRVSSVLGWGRVGGGGLSGAIPVRLSSGEGGRGTGETVKTLLPGSDFRPS